MIHPHVELRRVNDEIGYGVFATRDIPVGTVVWAQDDLDQTFSQAEVDAMAPRYRAIIDRYSFVDAKGKYVLCWDHSRYFNHSCDANCLSAGDTFEIAVRDIPAGSELTDDYGTLNPREPFPCSCGLPQCRKVVLPDDMDRLAHTWDVHLRRALPSALKVQQPLWGFLRDPAALEAMARDPSRMRSIRGNYVPVG